MITPEQQLETYYRDHREKACQYFLDRLVAANLKSYVDAPRDATLVALGRAIDNLVQVLVSRSPEAYVESQRDTFTRRIAAGIAVTDLFGGLDAAQESIDWMVTEALGDRPADAKTLMRRGQKYLLMTRTLLVTILSGKSGP